MQDFTELGFLDQIDRKPSGLPVIVHRQYKLCQQISRKVGGGYQSSYEPFGPDFIIDMPNLQTGWVTYEKGVGRVPCLVKLGRAVPAKPANGSAVAVVPVASEATHAELQIDDMLIKDAFTLLYREYKSSNTEHLPIVSFTGGLAPCFKLLGFEPRDEVFWGALLD